MDAGAETGKMLSDSLKDEWNNCVENKHKTHKKSARLKAAATEATSKPGAKAAALKAETLGNCEEH